MALLGEICHTDLDMHFGFAVINYSVMYQVLDLYMYIYICIEILLEIISLYIYIHDNDKSFNFQGNQCEIIVAPPSQIHCISTLAWHIRAETGYVAASIREDEVPPRDVT